MNETIYGVIANELISITPIGWKEIIFYGEIGEGSFSFEYYVKYDQEFIQCFKINSINRRDIMSSFRKIYLILNDELLNLGTNDRWTNMTLMFDKNGIFKCEFDYTNLTNNSNQYRESWKEKYISSQSK